MPAFRALGVRGDYPPPAAAGGRETGLGHLHVSGSASRPPTPRQTAREETLGTQYYGGSLSLERLWARAARRRRSSYAGVSLWTPLRPLPQWLAAPFLGLCITGSSPLQAGGDGGGECGSSSSSHAHSLAPAHASPLTVRGGVTNPTTVCSARRWQGKHN